MVLDMGEPVRILAVAERLIEVSNRRDIQIKYTGLRAGEKSHEALFSGSEAGVPSEHPLITRVTVPVLSPEEINFGAADTTAVLELLRSQSTVRDAMARIDCAARPLATQPHRRLAGVSAESGWRE